MKTFRHILLLAALSYVFFMLGNGLLPLSNPDEVFYAQTAREMAARHEWNTPFLFGQPQFEKPILIYWLLRIAFLTFGTTEFAARFFPAVFGALGAIGIYLLALLGFKSRRKGLISALLLMSSALYFSMARTVFTDMVFSVLILFSIVAFFWAYSCPTRKDSGIMLFFLAAGLATLAKGPLGLLLPLITVTLFLWLRKEARSFIRPSLFAGIAIYAIVCLPWYVYITAKYGHNFLHEFFYNDHIRRLLFAEHGHNDRWYFYPATIIGLFFPWCFLLAAALYRLFRSRKNLQPVQQLLACWVAVVFVVFQAAHSKLASYILPLFPALALACGEFIDTLLMERSATGRRLFLYSWLVLLLLPVCLAVAVAKFGFDLPPVATGLFAVILLAWLALMLIFIRQTRLLLAFYLLVLTLPLLLFIVPIDKEKIEPYFSSEDIGTFIQETDTSTKPLLAAKSFARGVLYYSGRPVAVFAPGESNYFSPHPVVFLDTREKVADFLRRNGETYCVLKQKQGRLLEEIARQIGYRCQVLYVTGNACLFKVGPTHQP